MGSHRTLKVTPEGKRALKEVALAKGPGEVGVVGGHVCTWKEDEYGAWWSDCGEGLGFEFMDQGPKDNNFKYCPYCSYELVEKKYDETASD